ATNLTVLQRQDPALVHIITTSPQASLYAFCTATHAWEKQDVEGTLFLYLRQDPQNPFGMAILNRLTLKPFRETLADITNIVTEQDYLIYQ
ncbi:hypothetical protein CXG81DRAFT_8091, partial [Caulochytrium protostelioides]